MDSKSIVGLIEKVVKGEVKQQVKEELAKLIKSGAITLNSQRKSPTTSLKQVSEITTNSIKTHPNISTNRSIKRDYSKDPMINEILNMTQPFTSDQRKEGAHAVSSVLDMMQPQVEEDSDGWETMDYRGTNVPASVPSLQSTGDALQDATIKALTRNYSELVSRF
jgi:hemoglobin-like flavoprotein